MKQVGFVQPVDGLRQSVDAPMSRGGHEMPQIGKDQGVTLAHDLALQAALDFLLRQTLGGASWNVCLDPRIAAHSNHCDGPQGVVRGTIATPVQSMARRLSR